MFNLFAGRMAEIGIPFMLTRTRCTKEEQAALYAQGRTKPGLIVTWTLKSRHINGEAFDIAIINDGQPIWVLKVNVNANDVGDYYEAGQIAEAIGLEWGGRFKPKPDYCHFQLPKGGRSV